MILDEVVQDEHLRRCANEVQELPGESWFHYNEPGFELKKSTFNRLDLMSESLNQLFEKLSSEAFVSIIEGLTGMSGLKCDLSLWGAGVHKTVEGGYLAIHRDFSVHPKTFREPIQWRRVLNLIGYLSDLDGDDGALEFRNPENNITCKVPVKFNSWVLFDTRDCRHGHPNPLQGSERLSVAVYYYLPEVVQSSEWTSTQYDKLDWLEDTFEYRQRRIERADWQKRYSQWL